MFKELKQGFAKFFTKDRVLILFIFLVLSWALLSYSGSKINVFDGMDDGHSNSVQFTPQPPAPLRNNIPASGAVANQSMNSGAGYALHPVANPSDLLPKDQNSQWSALNPNTQDNVGIPDLLTAGSNIGVIAQVLRNPTYDIRSDPIIPRSEVGPWNQSTIEPDIGRVPLEIGQGPR